MVSLLALPSACERGVEVPPSLADAGAVSTITLDSAEMSPAFYAKYQDLLKKGRATTGASPAVDSVRLEGRVVDADSGAPLPSRLYVQGDDGQWRLARSASAEGSAVPYEKRRGESVEVHTTLSAHPFALDLPAGRYTLTAERGKECFTATVEVTISPDGEVSPATPTLRLKRWIDMAALGWYSGDTHVHRGLQELPNVLLAEDLNVAFPLLYWVTKAFVPPALGDKSVKAEPGSKPIAVDPTHVIYPRNTEYEIFSVGDKRHELGAVFLLGHSSVLSGGVPPLGPVAETVHREGGLVELDKHAWPWSMALVPVMRVDLYELSNNHVWRTRFGYVDWGAAAPAYMQIERDEKGWTEWGWIDYGLQNYYALLNCGFRLRPTAGTASGVHPVPLGFSRVYVRLEESFSYRAWLRGLDAGRSFVTTGPMLFLECTKDGGENGEGRIRGSIRSAGPLERVEVVRNGEVVRRVEPANAPAPAGARESVFDLKVRLGGSAWIAVRAFERAAEGRMRFAHTAPTFFDVPGKPLRPRREEVEFLVRRVEEEIARSEAVLPAEALAEYREALRVYREILREAREDR